MPGNEVYVEEVLDLGFFVSFSKFLDSYHLSTSVIYFILPLRTTET